MTHARTDGAAFASRSWTAANQGSTSPLGWVVTLAGSLSAVGIARK